MTEAFLPEAGRRAFINAQATLLTLHSTLIGSGGLG
jgi:hypothetical protein